MRAMGPSRRPGRTPRVLAQLLEPQFQPYFRNLVVVLAAVRRGVGSARGLAQELGLKSRSWAWAAYVRRAREWGLVSSGGPRLIGTLRLTEAGQDFLRGWAVGLKAGKGATVYAVEVIP